MQEGSTAQAQANEKKRTDGDSRGAEVCRVKERRGEGETRHDELAGRLKEYSSKENSKI